MEARMNQEQIIKEYKERFYEKFECLVKPTAYTFTKDGEKHEVEASAEIRDEVFRFMAKELAQAVQQERDEWEVTIKHHLDNPVYDHGYKDGMLDAVKLAGKAFKIDKPLLDKAIKSLKEK